MIGHYDPYNLFDELFTEDGSLKLSSPRMTKFENLPPERAKMALEVDESLYVNNDMLDDYSRYFAKIEPRRCGNYTDVSNIPQSADYVLIEKTQNKDSSRIVEVRLQHPNGWSAETAIGSSFGDMHEHVTLATGALVMPKPEAIVDRCIQSKGMERIGAISFRQSPELNRHPDFYTPETYWFDENPSLYLRFERQGILGIPQHEMFLFTIQTFFVDLTIPKNARKALIGLGKSGHLSYARGMLAEERGKRLMMFLQKNTESI